MRTVVEGGAELDLLVDGSHDSCDLPVRAAVGHPGVRRGALFLAGYHGGPGFAIFCCEYLDRVDSQRPAAISSLRGLGHCFRADCHGDHGCARGAREPEWRPDRGSAILRHLRPCHVAWCRTAAMVPPALLVGQGQQG